MSQRSDNGTRNHGTCQSASLAQRSQDDKLRSSFLNIHVYRKIRQTDTSVAWAETKDRNKQHNLTAILTNQNSSKIEERSCQLYASTSPSRTTKLRPQMCSSSTEQSRATAGSFFCAPKIAGLVLHFEIGVQCAFENLAWQRHFTNQQLPTPHCQGGPMSFNQSNLVLSGGLKLK